jgi:addiction module HigA family antidote
MTTFLKYPHPGEIIKEEYLTPLKISQYRLAEATGMPHSRVTALIHGRVGITADTALRLAKFFDTDPQSWMNLQTSFDLRTTDKLKHRVYEKIHTAPELQTA